MKKILTAIVCLCVLVANLPCSLNVAAAQEGDFSYRIEDGAAIIWGYSGEGGDVVIPAELGGYSVTAIEAYAFERCITLTSISMPDSMKKIGGSAFSGCLALTSINFGFGVTSIGGEAFYGCDSLKEVEIPDNVTTIRYAAFGACAELTSVTIGKGVISIEEAVFEGCINLTTVAISSENASFSACDGVLFNKDMTTLIAYPAGRTSHYTIPDSVEVVQKYAFRNCYKLSSITIPNNVITIEERAFENCGLKRVTFPSSMSTIGVQVFSGCYDLTAITIPESITTISYGAFSNCANLKEVYYTGTQLQKKNITVYKENKAIQNATWHYECINPKDHFSYDVLHSVMDVTLGYGLAFRFDLMASVGQVDKNKAEYDNATINYKGETCKLVGMGAVMSNCSDITLDRSNVNDETVVDVPVVFLADWTLESCAFFVRIINIPTEMIDRTIYARPYYIVEVDGGQVVVYGDVDSASCAEYM